MTTEARLYAIEAIHALVKTMRNETGAARIAAARELLDRGYGRPAQNVDLTLSKKINELSLDELVALEEQIAGATVPALAGPSQTSLLTQIDDEALGPRIELDEVIDA